MVHTAEKPSFLKRLGQNKRGNVAMIFALAIIPILSAAGFAIDFQMTTTRKNKVQTVMDSAVLAGARAMQAGMSEEDIRSTVTAYIDAQVDTVGETLSCQEVDISFPEGSKDIQLDILCYQDTSLMKIIGKDSMGFRVSTGSTWGIGKLDVAFMFDVSGSMASDNRMTHLKEAAQEAVDTLLPADGGAATEDVRIAMVSYNSMVNAGDFFEGATGLTEERTYHAIDRWPAYTGNVTYVHHSRKRKYWHCDTFGNGECTSGWYKVRTRDEPIYETVDREDPVSTTITSTCVWERFGDQNFSDFSPGGSNPPSPISDIYDANVGIYNAADDQATNVEGYLAAAYAAYEDDPDNRDDDNRSGYGWYTDGTSECRNIEPLALTQNRTSLTNYINALSTGGGTAGQQGVAWAWYLVAEPWQSIFTGDGAPLDYDEPDSVKAVILMTDGEFNREEFGEQGDSDEQARAVCDAIKDNGKVVIYTVAFQAPTSGEEVLNYCASGPEFAFAPDNGEELTQAYQAIATSISDLRINY